MLASLSVLLIVANAVSAQTLNPKNDPKNYLGYIASPVLAGIACGASVASRALTTNPHFVSIALFLNVALAQTWFIRKWGAKWMLAMTIAAYCKFVCCVEQLSSHFFLSILVFSIGLITRVPLHYNPNSKMIFLAQSLLIVLSVSLCAFFFWLSNS